LVIALGIFFNHSISTGVLSYATDTSPNGLLTCTNTERTGAGIGGVALDSQLSQAAQAKADDMAARNYWSHNTPDGKEPWVFVKNAGYNYQAVGENLAYGFGTSCATITGWMNSPSHRENMLNSVYTDVGFGLANVPNYQSSGNQTIVVAMYGKPATAVAANTQTEAAKPPVSSSPSYSMTEQSISTPGDEPAPSETAPVETTGSQDMTVRAVVPAQEEQKVARVQLAASGSVPSWSVFAISILALGLIVALITRHSVAWHRVIVRGEQFILKHKVLDIAIVSGIMIAFILTRTVGVIQ
jgi:hypothetical protein